jgi:hypothetical protein
MGEAKRRRLAVVPTVYHHTSTLRTNLIWMSGVIQVEGNSKGVMHPQLGEVKTEALFRRPMRDFPPVAWFTTRIEIPGILKRFALYLEDKNTGEIERVDLDQEMVNGISLNRVALGFRIGDIGVTPWPQHPGYFTAEGQELNETAREAGDKSR